MAARLMKLLGMKDIRNIKEFHSSCIKENGKIDIYIKCDDKKFQFLNCEILADKDYNTYDRNLKFKYDNYEFV